MEVLRHIVKDSAVILDESNPRRTNPIQEQVNFQPHIISQHMRGDVGRRTAERTPPAYGVHGSTVRLQPTQQGKNIGIRNDLAQAGNQAIKSFNRSPAILVNEQTNKGGK